MQTKGKIVQFKGEDKKLEEKELKITWEQVKECIKIAQQKGNAK